MIYMSFHNGTLNRRQLKYFIEHTDKKIVYTYGFTFKNPTIYRKPITKDEAVRIVDAERLLDAKEYTDCLHLNAFSSNDMW